MTDREMVAKLVEVAEYFAGGGLSKDNPGLMNQVMEIGRDLNQKGGIKEMRRVFNMIPPMTGRRTVEMQWDGIGEWRG